MDKENEDGKGELVSGNFWRGGEEKRKKKRRKKVSRGNILFCGGGDELGRKIFGEGQFFFAEEKKTRKRKIFFGEGEGKGEKYLKVENICFA